MDKMLRSKKWILLFLLPALLSFTATVFVPIIWSMVYSLYSWNGVSAMRFVGLENFADMFSDKNFVQSVVNNLIFVAINVVGQLFVGAFVAVLLTYVGKGREVFKTLYFTPVILASVAVAKIWSKFFSVDPDGVVNSLLELVGLGGLKTAWLGNAATSLGSVSLVESYWHMALFMVIIYSGLITISEDVLESAVMDGASAWKMFWKIKLPLMSEVFVVALVMVVNGCLKAFDIIFISTSGGPGYSSELVATYMYKVAFTSAKYGYGSAIALFLVVESMIAVMLIRKIANRVQRNSL